MKTGNTYPPIRRRIPSEETGGVLDFTDWNVRFHMRDAAGNVLIDAEAVVEAPAATSGVVRYDWAEGDTDIAGHYYGEFEFTNTETDKVFTLPSGEEYEEIIIGDAIA